VCDTVSLKAIRNCIQCAVYFDTPSRLARFPGAACFRWDDPCMIAPGAFRWFATQVDVECCNGTEKKQQNLVLKAFRASPRMVCRVPHRRRGAISHRKPRDRLPDCSFRLKETRRVFCSPRRGQATFIAICRLSSMHTCRRCATRKVPLIT
jgi:hypothetical protein